MDRTLGIQLLAAAGYGVFYYFFQNETPVVKTLGFLSITIIQILVLVYYKLEDMHLSITINNR